MTREELETLVRDVCLTTGDGVHVVDSGRVKMTYEQIEELLRRERGRAAGRVERLANAMDRGGVSSEWALETRYAARDIRGGE